MGFLKNLFGGNSTPTGNCYANPNSQVSRELEMRTKYPSRPAPSPKREGPRCRNCGSTDTSCGGTDPGHCGAICHSCGATAHGSGDISRKFS